MSSTRVLGGRYRLLNRLGSGGQSAVWRAYDQALDRTVAVKLLAGGSTGAAGRELPRAEASTAAQLSHSHICQVYDHGESRTESGEHVAYIVMELLSGPTLEERLQAYYMPVRVALRSCAQVASALAAAHSRGLVHRDLTPANVILTPTGPKVVDFGIPAADGEIAATPADLAPERLRDGKAKPASDVYALGLMIYRMVSGTAPWPAGAVTQMLENHEYQPPAPLPPVDGLPEPVADLCWRCLAEDPRERPTAHEVARRLAGVVGLQVSRGGEQLIAPGDGPAGPAEAPATPVDDPAGPAAEAAAATETRPVQPEAAPAGPPAVPPAPPTEAVAAIPDPGRRPPAPGGGDHELAPGPHVRRHHHRRRPVLLAAAAVFATVAVLTGGTWMAHSATDRYQPGAVAASDEPSVGSPATDPASIASPGGGLTGPTHPGRGEPRDAPGDSSPEPADTEDHRSPPPGTAPPEPAPGTSETPEDPEPDPAQDVLETPGGTVLPRCAGSTASVEPLDLAPGYRVLKTTQGPGVIRAGMVLGSSEREVRIDVECRAGKPVSTVHVG